MAHTLVPLNAPLITTEDVIEALRLTIPSEWNVPIYPEFPSDSDIVRYGIYVSDVHTIERSVHQLGIQYCASIYHAVDQFGVTYVSFQDDPHNVAVNAIIANLVTDEVAGRQLMEGYFQRTFSQTLFYGPQAEKHTWLFNMTRLEFNT